MQIERVDLTKFLVHASVFPAQCNTDDIYIVMSFEFCNLCNESNKHFYIEHLKFTVISHTYQKINHKNTKMTKTRILANN